MRSAHALCLPACAAGAAGAHRRTEQARAAGGCDGPGWIRCPGHDDAGCGLEVPRRLCCAVLKALALMRAGPGSICTAGTAGGGWQQGHRASSITAPCTATGRMRHCPCNLPPDPAGLSIALGAMLNVFYSPDSEQALFYPLLAAGVGGHGRHAPCQACAALITHPCLHGIPSRPALAPRPQWTK